MGTALDYKQLLKLLGICDHCCFKGILAYKQKILPTSIDPTPVDAENIRHYRLCMTCSATPNGMVSENLLHKPAPRPKK